MSKHRYVTRDYDKGIETTEREVLRLGKGEFTATIGGKAFAGVNARVTVVELTKVIPTPHVAPPDCQAAVEMPEWIKQPKGSARFVRGIDSQPPE